LSSFRARIVSSAEGSGVQLASNVATSRLPAAIPAALNCEPHLVAKRSARIPPPKNGALPGPTKRDLERYRSGHNGADSKSDGRVIPARGFESHPLRQIVSPIFQALNYTNRFWRQIQCQMLKPRFFT